MKDYAFGADFRFTSKTNGNQRKGPMSAHHVVGDGDEAGHPEDVLAEVGRDGSAHQEHHVVAGVHEECTLRVQLLR